MNLLFFRSKGTCTCRHKFAHVELQFSDSSTTSILRNPGRVHILENPLFNSHKSFGLSVTPETERLMRYYAEHCDDVFSSITMYWNFIIPIWTRREGTFCSAYICKLLQIAGYCSELDPYRTSPDDLYNWFYEEG